MGPRRTTRRFPRAVVALKAELERFREQVQNVE
ncbi:MAG: DUF1732 domain-containing protein [Verrucomicrobia bacterium]|nr:DUF1732 domain-containing protein [Verrucomicrobiota bacterium]